MTWRVKPSCKYIEWAICYKWPPEWDRNERTGQLVRTLVRCPEKSTYYIQPEFKTWLTTCSAEWSVDLDTQELVFESQEDYVRYLLEFLN